MVVVGIIVLRKFSSKVDVNLLHVMVIINLCDRVCEKGYEFKNSDLSRVIVGFFYEIK